MAVIRKALGELNSATDSVALRGACEIQNVVCF
jgi:hypothetical protein